MHHQHHHPAFNFFKKIKSFVLFSFLLSSLCLSLTARAEVPVQELKTEQQIPILFVEDKSSQLTSVFFAFKAAGSAYDPEGKEGLCSMMTNLLFEQAKRGFTHNSLNKKLKDIGILGGINASVDADNIVFHFKAPTDKLKEAFLIFKEIITDPDFDSQELDKMKTFDPAGSRLASSSEREFASKVLMQKIFNGQSYAKPSYGTLDGRQSVTLEDVKQAYQERLVLDRLIFSVVGNVSGKNLTQMIHDTFKHLPKKSELAALTQVDMKPSGEVTLIPKNTPQSGVVFGQPTVSRLDKDYLPLVIVNDIIGGRPFTSRLWMEAREKRGLVYQIDTNFNHWAKSSLLSGQFEADNQKTPEMIKLIKETWQELKNTGVTEEEFIASKKGLLGEYALMFTSPDGIAQYLLSSHLAGFPKDYINKGKSLFEAITLEQVNQATKQHLDPDHLTFVVVGQP